MHARKSLLYKDGEPWIKKNTGLFDVTMGAYDGAEVCELVGMFILSQLSNYCSKAFIGLYRDDGLAVLKNESGPNAEKTKKEFQKIFNEHCLKIEIKCNLKVVDYLDVTLNLNDGSYKPYRKENDDTLYVNAKSNHPPNIIKQLPLSIEKRLQTLSSSKEVFDEAAKHYQQALNKCGYSHVLQFKKHDAIHETSKRRNRKRKVIWFNPPYSKSVETNVAKYFLNLIDKHFPPHNKLRKLFNRNNLKVSYSSTRNIKASLSAHNKAVLAQKPNRNQKSGCNCRNSANCPLDGNCLSENTLYAALITSDLPEYGTKKYVGISAPPFKERYGNHKCSFNNRDYSKCIIAKEVWHIKDQGGKENIEWQILGHAPAYTPAAKKCSLCISEKLYIAENHTKLINKRDELISKCRHRNKYIIQPRKRKK